MIFSSIDGLYINFRILKIANINSTHFELKEIQTALKQVEDKIRNMGPEYISVLELLMNPVVRLNAPPILVRCSF